VGRTFRGATQNGEQKAAISGSDINRNEYKYLEKDKLIYNFFSKSLEVKILEIDL
jgi:hypothetical protein